MTSPATYMWFLDLGDVVSSHGRPKLYPVPQVKFRYPFVWLRRTQVYS